MPKLEGEESGEVMTLAGWKEQMYLNIIRCLVADRGGEVVIEVATLRAVEDHDLIVTEAVDGRLVLQLRED